MRQIIFLLLISHFSFSQLVPSFHAVHHKKIYSGIGDASDNPAESCKAILDNNAGALDGVYWINLPTVGATQCYCLMDSDYDGGGWILAMKATRGTTFSYSASYWTSVNTLNPSEVNRDDGDAKFHSMNYFQAKDAMALFPDFPNIGTESGSIDNLSMWSWLENDFYNNGSRTTLLLRLQSTTTITSTPQTSFDGYNSTYFSSQSGFQFYGFNYTYSNFKVRWGFAWNNEGSQGSNDAWGGIGLYLSPYNYSAGDRWHWSGVTVRGANRSARVEIYVR